MEMVTKNKWVGGAIAVISGFLIIWLAFVLAQHTHLEDNQFQLNPVQFFTFILSGFTFLLVVGALLIYRDRQAMREEYKEKRKEIDDLIAQKKTELEALAVQNQGKITELIVESEVRLQEKYESFDRDIANKRAEIEGRCEALDQRIKEREQALDGRVGEVFDKADKYEAALAEKLAKPKTTTLQSEKDAVRAFNRGVDFYEAGKFADAVAKYREAIHLKPDLGVAHLFLGIALGKQGKNEDAERAFREAINKGKQLYSAHLNLGVALGKQGRIAEAITTTEETINLNKDIPDAHYNLASWLALSNRKDSAFQSLSLAVEKGFEYWPLMERDKDLDNLRGDSRFKALAEKVKARWEEKEKKEGKGK